MDVLRAYSELSSIRNNQHFIDAINTMKDALVEQEDALIRDINLSDEALSNGMKRCAMMRVLLTDMVEMLDGYILEAQNLQFEDGMSQNN